MAKHEFGIMPIAPKAGKRYDEYEPQKYNCIFVDDDYVEKINPDLASVDFYWHTTDHPAKGIAYTGITLIPPTSMATFTEVIRGIDGFKELENLLEKARSENKWMIHFGL